MKKFLFILFLMPSIIFAQSKYVKIPQAELDAVIAAIDTLEHQDSLKTVLITDLEVQLTEYKTLSLQNDTLLTLRNDEIVLLNDQIKLYSDRLKITDRWYNKRWFGVVIGVVGTSSAIYLAGQID